jgi:uncharacterized protein YkwD
MEGGHMTRHGRLTAALIATALMLAAAMPANAAAGPQSCSKPRGAGPRALAARALCLVNHERAGRGLRPLRSSRPLRRAAISHARDMVRRRYFSHVSLSGADFDARIRRAGYRGRSVGEAIVWGTDRRVAPLVRCWMDSPTHRAILLGNFRDVGLGAALGTPGGGRGGVVLVLDAGR